MTHYQLKHFAAQKTRFDEKNTLPSPPPLNDALGRSASGPRPSPLCRGHHHPTPLVGLAPGPLRLSRSRSREIWSAYLSAPEGAAPEPKR